MQENNIEQLLALARTTFDSQVEVIVADRQRQAAELSRSLNTYLRRWCDCQHSISNSFRNSSADDVAAAKHNLADHVRHQLIRVNGAICYQDLPTMLYAQSSKKNRPGYFSLMLKGSKKPLISRSSLSDLLAIATPPASTEPGFAVIEGSVRREPLAEWHVRTKRPPPSPDGPLQRANSGS